ncbi:MAG: hypothetical protein VXV95_01170 [Candidatus Thermoplasmatota archaeon]|nr:hypothetical protein [Candidatus Thermoplasmatota archaeon]
MGFRKSKKKSATQAPNPTLPPAPLPPLPGMTLPAPESVTAPDLPIPAELPPVTIPTLGELPPPSLLNEASNIQEQSTNESSDGYGELWAKKSNKPLPQIYGHIDRISAGEAGSLLDRYADRFGHSLDRDIIVLRKQQHDEKLAEIRDAPIVELLDDEDQSPQQILSNIEDEIRKLKPSYQEAKSSGDNAALAELKPQLESLLRERKLLLAEMAGEDDEYDDEPEQEAEPVVAQEAETEDIFVTFVSIVDELLGSNLPGDVVEAFVGSEEFSIYQTVGSDPMGADDEMRGLFFGIVDNQLGNMDQKSIEEFVASSDFSIYSSVGEMYQ